MSVSAKKGLMAKKQPATLANIPLVTSTGSSQWQESLARVVPAIVVIRVCLCSAFDGDSPGYSYATGFVVDKARGIILTNRHVVTPGPTVTDAVFMNKEEVDLVPIYYDPVHDFGFFRFDPKAVKFLGVAEIELNPDGAKVGVEIRVVGNDSGEKLSILPGILARLDRAAPDYGAAAYRDFNTFYLAAASSTSGGSSGSPVLTVDGKAVALNCGARAETAAAFYLPLPKIAQALEIIQRGERVERGTIQTVLKHTAFDEARRLGLSAETEKALREEFPEETGVLVVNQVIPKGPAAEILEPGDVVVRMNEKLITTFLPWESYLDSAVGGEVEVQVQRGGKEITATVKVGDLHNITPSEYLDVSSGVMHPLSYQQARNYNLPVEGVYLAQAGYMLERAWIVSQCLITSIGTDPTPNLDACEAALCKHPDGARLALRYKALTDRHRTKTAVITMDRKWFPMQRVRRNDEDGLWHATPSPLPPPPIARAPSSREEEKNESYATSDGGTAKSDALSSTGRRATSGGFGIGSAKKRGSSSRGSAANVAASITSTLVMVSFDIPHLVDGVSGSYCIGVGVIVDKQLGLVVVDRTTVQVALGDVMLTFNGSEEVAATPIFVHPVQNFSVVRFDPSTVKGSFAEAVLSSRETELEDDESWGSPPTPKRSSPPPERPSKAEGGVDGGDSTHASPGGEGGRDTCTAGDRSAVSGARECGPLSLSMPGHGSVLSPPGEGSDVSRPPLRPGDAAEFHGLTSANAPVRQRTVVVKLERLALASSTHPQFTAHSVEVLQFEQIASCLGGVFVALPREGGSDGATSWGTPRGNGTGGAGSTSSSHRPVVSAFWHSFNFSDSEGRKNTMRGLPAPVVYRSIDRIRRELLKARRAPTTIELGDSPRKRLAGSSQKPVSVPEEDSCAPPTVTEYLPSARGFPSTSENAALAEVVGETTKGLGSGLTTGGDGVMSSAGSGMSLRGSDTANELESVENDAVGADVDVDVEDDDESSASAPFATVSLPISDDGPVGSSTGEAGVVKVALDRGSIQADHDSPSSSITTSLSASPEIEIGKSSPLSSGREEMSPGVEESPREGDDYQGAAGADSAAALKGDSVADEPPAAVADSGEPQEDGTGNEGGDTSNEATDTPKQAVDNSQESADSLVTATTSAASSGDEDDAVGHENGGGGGGSGDEVPGTRSGIGLEGAEKSLGAAPCLPLQLVTVELSKARAGLGLSEEWSERIEEKCGERQKQVLEVRRCMVGTPAFAVVETGDIILAVEGKVVTRFREVEAAVEALDGAPVRLTVLRQNGEEIISVIPSYLPTRETDRLFMWAGLMIQTPHLAVLQLGFLPKEGGGVYSSRWCYGSPAHKYSLGCTTWIVEVNGVPTPTLDAFLGAVKDIGDKSPARVKMVGLDSKVEVTTFRTDHHYWPTLELRRSENGCWTRKLHTGPRSALESPPLAMSSKAVPTAVAHAANAARAGLDGDGQHTESMSRIEVGGTEDTGTGGEGGNTVAGEGVKDSSGCGGVGVAEAI